MSSPILATQSQWVGKTATWGEATNWSNGIPTGIAEFTNAGRRGITLSTNITLEKMIFDANAFAFTINTNGVTVKITGGIANNSDKSQRIINSTPNKGSLTFQDAFVSGNIIKIDNTTSGSFLAFTGNSSANNTRITNAENCTVDVSGLSPIGSSLSLGSISGAGDINLGSNTLTTGFLDLNDHLSGVISGLGGNLTKTGSGTLNLSGENTYTGTTTISAGTVQMQEAQSLPRETAVIVDAGATLKLANFSQSIGSLSGAGNVNFGKGTLTTGNDDTDTTYSGSFSGKGGLLKLGSGVFTVSGTNTYNGSTQIMAGTLEMGAIDCLPLRTAVTAGAGSYFNLANFSQEIGSLDGEGDVNLGTGILTLGKNNSDTFYSGNLSGTGGIVKVGRGTFTLSGVNTYHGETVINAGTLKVDVTNAISKESAVITQGTFDLENHAQSIGSLAGSGKVLLGTGTLTAGNDNTNTTYSGVLSGLGGFTKVGNGTQTLSGKNAYWGATNISDGMLQMGRRNSLPKETAVTVGSGSTLTLANFNQRIGSLSGEGNVDLGQAKLTTGKDQTDTTYSGVLSGAGGIIKLGSGVLTLSGPNIYTGGTVIKDGSLQGDSRSIQGKININQSSELIFNQNSIDGTFVGQLTGTGTIIKQGSKRLALTGPSPFRGPINVEAGTLLLNDSPPIPAAVFAVDAVPPVDVNANRRTLTILPNGTLMGSGKVYQDVVNNGLLSIGNPTQTGFESFTLQKSYQGNGIIQFNIDNDGNSSKLISKRENIDLRDTSLKLVSRDFIKSSHTYSLIETKKVRGDTIIGPFLSIPKRIGKFIPKIAYHPHDVQLLLEVQKTNYAGDCKRGNDRKVACYLDQLSSTAQDSLEEFIFQLEDLAPDQREDVFSQLTPASQASMSQSLSLGLLALSISQGRMRTLASHGQHAIATPSGFSSTGNANGPSFMHSFSDSQNDKTFYHSTRSALIEDNGYYHPFGKGRGGVWVQGFAISNHQKTAQGISGFGAKSGGLMTGVDTQVPKTNFHIGASVGYGRAEVSFKQGRGNTKINSHLASIYSIYDRKDFYVDAALACSMNKYRSDRNLPSLAKIAQSQHRGIEWSPHLGGGVNFNFWEVRVQPFISVDYLDLREGGYTEQNAGIANLTVVSASSSQWRGETGMNVSKTFHISDGALTLTGKLSYIRRQPHKNSPLTSGLVGQSTTFETETLNLKQNEVSPGVGFKMNLKNGVFIAGSYNAELSSISTVQEVGIKLGVRF